MIKKTLMLAVCCMLTVAASASARTIAVGGEDGEFQTIQAAIDAATAGDLIQVAPGLFRESLLISKNDLEIVGAGVGLTVVQSSDIVVSYLATFGGRFQGMTVRHAGGEAKPAFQIDASSPLIVDNEITGATLAGVEIHSGASPTLSENEIHDNAGSGVLIYLNSTVTLTGNNIKKNGLEDVGVENIHHPGVEVRGNSSATLQFNTILLNGGSGVFIHEASHAELLGNSIIGNGLHGISVVAGAGAQIDANSIWWNSEVGIRLRDNLAVSISGNFIAQNLIGVLVNEGDRLPEQNNNLYWLNTQDRHGVGLTSQDARFNDSVLVHPQFTLLFQSLGGLGQTLQALRVENPFADNALLIKQTQQAELIAADVYRLFGLTAEAEVRYRMVIRLDRNSDAAKQAQAALDAL